MLIRHHLDYFTNLTVLICKDCHDKEHFPNGKNGTRVVMSKRAKKQRLGFKDGFSYRRYGNPYKFDF
jgi:hypothetical protein